MRTLPWIFASLVAVFASVLLYRTYRHGPEPRRAGKLAPDASVDGQQVAAHLAEAVRFRTISHQDPGEDDRAAFAQLHAFLERSYPRVHARLERELVGDSLLYQWRGSDAKLPPILLLAHQDVVPVEPGTEKDWTAPPFDGVIADGFVWGRGTIDDKGPLICIFEALESLLAQGFVPARSVWLASGYDEEVGGKLGALRLATTLEQRGVHFEWLLDEGGAVTEGVVQDVARPVATIAVSEKGYLSLALTAHGPGGHSSMPPSDGAIHQLMGALARVEDHPFSPRATPTLVELMTRLGPEMPFLPRLIVSNLWLTSGLLVRDMAGQDHTSPLVRTSMAPTILQAGIKDNVVPSSARAVLNFRILPGESTASVQHVVDAIDDTSIEVTRLDRTESEPAKLASTSARGFRIIEATTHKFFPDAVVVPSVVSGATDARHFARVATDAYRFVPRLFQKADLKRIHGTDERVGVADLALATRAYRDLIKAGAAAK